MAARHVFLFGPILGCLNNGVVARLRRGRLKYGDKYARSIADSVLILAIPGSFLARGGDS